MASWGRWRLLSPDPHFLLISPHPQERRRTLPALLLAFGIQGVSECHLHGSPCNFSVTPTLDTCWLDSLLKPRVISISFPTGTLDPLCLLLQTWSCRSLGFTMSSFQTTAQRAKCSCPGLPSLPFSSALASRKGAKSRAPYTAGPSAPPRCFRPQGTDGDSA